MAGRKIEMLAGRLAARTRPATPWSPASREELAELDGWFGRSARAATRRRQARPVGGRPARHAPARCISEIERARSQAEALIDRAQALDAGLGRGHRPAARGDAAGHDRRSRSRPSAPRLRPRRRRRRSKRCRPPPRAADRLAESEAASPASARRSTLCSRPSARAGRGRGANARARRGGGEGRGAAARRSPRKPGRELIEALVRVREAAARRPSHAREAIAAVIPESAAALAAGEPRSGRRGGQRAGRRADGRDRRRRRAGDRRPRARRASG